MSSFIPASKVSLGGDELNYIEQAIKSGHLQGDGPFTKKCQEWLKEQLGGRAEVLLTHSGTAALEMTALLSGVGTGDEVIMPAFTFVSSANAFVLRGARPVFVDIREDTLNIDESLIEEAVTDRTRVIVPTHYAGVGCAMDELANIARRRKLLVIEDAAHGVLCRAGNQALGSIGHLGALSFHQTKNLVSGEGGALIINDQSFLERAEIIREKGTNRRQFLRKQVDRYTWHDLGSSFLPSDILAAFLFAQFAAAKRLQENRQRIYRFYENALRDLAARHEVTLPHVPKGMEHNAHIFHLLVPHPRLLQPLLDAGREKQIQLITHYVALHRAPAAARFARAHGNLPVTERVVDRLVRLPLYADMTEADADRVVDMLHDFFRML